MLSLVFSTFCSNHQKVIEAKRCDFFTTLPGCSSKSDIGVHHKLLAIVNAVATRPMFVLYAVPVPQWILFTVIGEVSKKSHWLISKLCVKKFRNLYERAFNANPDVCIFWTKFFQLVAIQLWPCCNMDGCWDPFWREIPSSLCSFSMQSHSRGPEIQRVRTKNWREKN